MFKTDELDLDRLIANLVDRKQQVAQYELAASNSEEPERAYWLEMVTKTTEEVDTIESLIKRKKKAQLGDSGD